MIRLPLPFLLAIGGIAVLCVMDAIIKAVGVRYPTFQLAFLRFVAGSIWTIAAVAILRPGFPSADTIRVNTLRGVIGLITATSFFYALQTLPLAETIAFSFLSPLFLALFGALILGEAIRRETFTGLILGFIGMLVMTFGHGLTTGGPLISAALHIPGVLAAVGSAISYAFGLVLLRQRAQQDALILIVLFQTTVPTLLLIGPAWWVWQPVLASDLWLFAVIGGLGLCGHMLLANAFKRAEASRLAPSEYSALVIAAVLGYVFFSEVPGIATLFGALLVISGTVIAMRAKGS
ncbi:MAG: DMT family transporter [Beijerinckiaceae bacterium]|jgi:S-adenosylmethionine uptake transporter|nr:DMT family transporter [Beijerinckiaceae bacterium]